MPAAIEVGNSLNLSGNELLNARVQSLSAAPAHAAGRIYYDTVLTQFGVSNGTTWTYLTASGGGLTQEQVEDIVGLMNSTSTVVTGTYDDPTGKILLTIGSGQITNAMVSGTAAINADKLVDGTANRIMLAAERTKLAGIAAGATVNDTDANLRARLSHTGTQVSATISDLAAAIDARIALTVGAAPTALDTLVELANAIGNDANFASSVTVALGLRALSANGTVPSGIAATVITHNLNTRFINLTVSRAATPFNNVLLSWEATTVNTVTAYFAVAPAVGEYSYLVVGKV